MNGLAAVGAALALSCAAAHAAAPPSVATLPDGTLLDTTTTSAGQPLDVPAHPELHVAVFTDPAGWASQWHEHLHPRYVYVLEGTLTVEDEAGKRESIPAGHASVEMLGRWHHGLNLGPGPVKFLVIDQVPPGSGPNMIMRSRQTATRGPALAGTAQR